MEKPDFEEQAEHPAPSGYSTGIEVFTVREMARRLGVTRPVAYGRLAGSGIDPVGKRGHAFLYGPDALAFLEAWRPKPLSAIRYRQWCDADRRPRCARCRMALDVPFWHAETAQREPGGDRAWCGYCVEEGAYGQEAGDG